MSQKASTWVDFITFFIIFILVYVLMYSDPIPHNAMLILCVSAMASQLLLSIVFSGAELYSAYKVGKNDVDFDLSARVRQTLLGFFQVVSSKCFFIATLILIEYAVKPMV